MAAGRLIVFASDGRLDSDKGTKHDPFLLSIIVPLPRYMEPQSMTLSFIELHLSCLNTLA